MMNRRISETETEKATFAFQLSEVQKRNKSQIERLQEQLAQAKRDSREQETKIQSVELIEEEIIKLFLEFKDRSAEVVMADYEERREELIEHEKRELRRNGKPLAIIERLKAGLRSLLAFKEDYENELKDQMNRRKTETEEELVDLRQKMDQLMKDNREHKDNAVQAIKIKDQAMTSKQEIIMESNNIISKVSSYCQKINQMIMDSLTLWKKILHHHNKITDEE